MTEYDNLCKYLAEKHPDRFASWLLGREITGTKVFKTELSLEPVRADSVTFLRLPDRILHLEFQVNVPQKKPMPLRMLNYWVRLYWQYNLPITQVLIWLKQTNNEAVLETQFQFESTQHSFQVIRMWEQPPELLLQSPALLPLAVLCQTDNATGLLSRVAAEVAKIQLPEEREEIIGSTQLLAGLRFDINLVRNLFRGGFMRESVVFQEIFQEGRVEGRVEGRQEGKQEGELAIIYRLLSRRIGTVTPELQQRLLRLSISQLEDLGEALLDFEQPDDLIPWLDRIESDRIEDQKETILATIYRLLPRRIGTVTPELQQRLLQLSVSQLFDLTEALLDFERPNDLIVWLDALQDS
jgi:predicted transposase YdaD